MEVFFAGEASCPNCGGSDEFYVSGTSPDKGCHCLHCNLERDDNGVTVTDPNPKDQWIGVKA